MQGKASGLTGVLSKQKEAYLRLAGIMREKADAIAAADLKKIKSLSEREESMAGEISVLENLKTEALAALSRENGLIPEKTGLRELISRLDENTAEEVNNTVLELTAAIREIKGLNSRNLYLLEARLKTSAFTAKAAEKAREAREKSREQGPGGKTDKSI